MANIKLQNLTSITGSDLFDDSESFMRDLSEDELELQGGWTPTLYMIWAGSSMGLAALL